jgi:hypothetical protein
MSSGPAPQSYFDSHNALRRPPDQHAHLPASCRLTSPIGNRSRVTPLASDVEVHAVASATAAGDDAKALDALHQAPVCRLEGSAFKHRVNQRDFCR